MTHAVDVNGTLSVAGLHQSSREERPTCWGLIIRMLTAVWRCYCCGCCYAVPCRRPPPLCTAYAGERYTTSSSKTPGSLVVIVEPSRRTVPLPLDLFFEESVPVLITRVMWSSHVVIGIVVVVVLTVSAVGTSSVHPPTLGLYLLL